MPLRTAFSRVGAALRRIPVLGDYVDGRAQSREDAATIPQWLLASLPPLLAYVLETTDALNRLLDGFVITALGLRVALPLMLSTACLVALIRRQRTSTPRKPPGPWRYRSPHHVRTIAKVALPPLLVLVGVRVQSMLPNALTGTEMVTGYLCLGSGGPVDHGYIQLLDTAGNPVGQRIEEIDSDGHFYIKPQPWRLAPVSLQLQQAKCKASVALEKASLTREACPGQERLAIPDQPQEEYVWFVQCDPS